MRKGASLLLNRIETLHPGLLCAVRAVELKGGARQAELVPEFLKRLGDAESFDGQRFGRLEVTQTADDDAAEGVVDFAVLAPVGDSAS